ncbi:MAG: T9SS type A sorting domain-containing protein, partial [Bacteroidales bacterium]|nr:T9SS type A sorting domain-containing protein [Bacteroidales bacterium]
VNGCDSVVTLHLTINESEIYEFAATDCDSYTWNNEIYTTSGDYVQTFQNALGCDSVVTLHLTINISDTTEFSETACNTYTWNNEIYTETGEYEQTLLNQNGCDSIVTLHLTINVSDTTEFSETVCNTYTWNNENYTETGEYEQTLLNQNGCDSIVTLHLTINVSDTTEFSETLCNTYVWNEQTYTETGDYEQTLLNQNGCDSIVTLHLMINVSDTTEFSETACNTYTWNNEIYTETGEYEQTLHNQSGCDSIVTLHLTINVSDTTEFSETVCNTYTWNNENYTETGEYEQTLLNQNGCDSIVTLHLTINVSDTTEFSKTLCNTYVWNEQTYTETGDYEQTLHNQSGCDSIVTLHLTINVSDTTEFSETLCNTYIWNNEIYTETGDYVQTLENQSGCDSIVTLHLTINDSDTTEFSATACNTYTWNNEIYTESGDYEQTLHNQSGCDSIVTLHLMINVSDTTEFSETLCNTYVWNEQTYTETGDYVQTLLNQSGCDSIVTLHLTINVSDTTEFSATACDSYIWNNVTYTESGNYEQTLWNINGCDSVVQMNLIINYSFDSSWQVQACEGEIIQFKDTVISTTGNYSRFFTTVNGCDSTYHLMAIFHPEIYVEEFQDLCQGDVYLWHEMILMESGIYRDTLQSIYGCDSVCQLHLTVHPTYALQEETIEICAGESLEWHDHIYSFSGTYDEINTTVYGCDSSYRLHLNVGNQYYFSTDMVHCGQTFQWHGQNISTAGIYYDSLQTTIGCDSIYQMILYPNQYIAETEYVTICYDDSLLWHNRIIKEPGIYYDTIASYFGCDSILTLDLTMNQSFDTIIFDTICHGENYVKNGFVFSVDSIEQLMQIFGSHVIYAQINYSHLSNCDSLIQLYLTVEWVHFVEENREICNYDTLFWHEQILTEAGEFFDTVYYASGCIDSIFKLTLLTEQPPILNVSTSDDAVCLGESALLIATGGDVYLWNTQATTSSIVVMPTETTTYSVCAISNLGCRSDTISITIEVYPPLSPYIQGDSSICSGDSVILYLQNGGENCIWNNGASTDYIKVAPLQTTLYSVNTFDTHGCSYSASFLVKVDQVDPPLSVVAMNYQNYIKVYWSSNAQDFLIFRNNELIGNSSSNMYNDVDVVPNIYYCYTVQAQNDFGCLSENSNVSCVIIDQPCDPPTQLTVSKRYENGQELVDLHWEISAAADSYQIFANNEWIGNATTNYYVDTIDHREILCYYVKAMCFNQQLSVESNTACLSVNAIDEVGNDYLVYPNPVSHHLVVKGNNLAEIVIYNSIGQQQKVSMYRSDESIVIDVSKYESGYYLLKMMTQDGYVVTKRVVVAR